jgi:hypothetical protein
MQTCGENGLNEETGIFGDVPAPALPSFYVLFSLVRRENSLNLFDSFKLPISNKVLGPKTVELARRSAK